MARRAAAYLRVSSTAQADEDRFGYHRQIAGIRAYAERADLDLVREYRDAITGKSVSRQGLDQLIRDAAEFETVIISSVDRLARDVTSSYQVLANLLASKVVVHSADQGLIDLDQESSLIQFNLQALFAHLERHKIVARTRAAITAIAEAGGIPDGMRTFGYRTVKRAAEVVPTEAAVVRDVYERSAAGESLVSIAAHLTTTGVPRRTGASTPWRFTDVRQMIRRTTYKGEYRWGEYVIPVPPIVGVDLWARAQPRGRGGKWTGRTPLKLIGHVRCGQCGNRLSTLQRSHPTNGTRYYSYRCSGKAYPGSTCSLPTISGNHLDPLAEKAVRQALSRPAVIREMLGAAAQVEDQNAAAIERLQEEERRWLEAFRARAITAKELAAYRADVRRRLRALEAPAASAELDVDAYVQAARTLQLRELLALAHVEIVVWDRNRLDVTLLG